MMAETRQGSFAAQIKEFSDKTKRDMDGVVREITFGMAKRIIERSPVGNPELWKINKVAIAYNAQVDIHNASLRSFAENLDKAGRLKRGLKQRYMDIKVPMTSQKLLKIDSSGNLVTDKGTPEFIRGESVKAGYVGGHFVANWQFGTTIPTGEIDGVDPDKTATIAAIAEAIAATGAGGITYLVNNAPYAIPLEYGHSTQAPQGMVRVTIAEFNQVVEQAVQEVKS